MCESDNLLSVIIYGPDKEMISQSLLRQCGYVYCLMTFQSVNVLCCVQCEQHVQLNNHHYCPL